MEQEKLKNTVIECTNISKKFLTPDGKDFQVIENINLDVRENEFLVVFGPGQCGKTTLLNMLCGLLETDTGEIRMNGKKVTKPDPSRGMVYQTMALFPWLSVKKNIAFGPRMRGLDAQATKKKTQYYIDLVGLTGFEKHYPIQLSGGMQQRVGIARAYCNEPLVLFMDEPFGHLDAQTRYKMEADIEEIWEKEKRSLIFVTNNIEEAIYLADRIVVMSNCPSTIAAEYTVDLPRPRKYTDKRFLELRREILKHTDESL